MARCAPPVAIVMGSQSDWETMKEAADILKALGVRHAPVRGGARNLCEDVERARAGAKFLPISHCVLLI